MAVVVVAIIVIVIAMQNSEPEVEIIEEEVEPSIIGVSLDITAEGWNEDTSTPVVAMFTVYEEEAETEGEVTEEVVTPIYKELSANTEEPQIVELDAGDYTLTLISPINEDGSVYSVGDDVVVTADEITDDTEAIELILIPAEEVTTEEIESIITALTVASTLDDTVVSTEVLDRAKTNAAAGPNVSIDDVAAVEEVAEQTAEAVESGEATAQAVTTTTTNANNNSNSGSAGSNASSNGGSAMNNSASNNGTSTSSNTSSNSGGSTSNSSSHTHNWVAQTETKKVVDTPATSGYAVCNQCGAKLYSQSEITAHQKASKITSVDEYNANGGHWYSCYSYYTVDGTAEVSHTETVTTGYKCSVCGATK